MDTFDHFLLNVVYDIPSLIFVVDPVNNRIIYANQHMRQRLGDDCVGKLFAQYFGSAGGDHFFVSYSHSRVAEGSNDIDDVPMQSEYYDDETENWYHVLQRPITWHDNTRKIGFVLNEINLLKRMQKELSEAHAALAIKNRELQIAAKTDRLTQIFNRHQLDEVMQSELNRSRRSGKVFSIFIIDCDHFKMVNDMYGHQTGDLVLVDMAMLIKDAARVTDTIGRWGGEEFLVILPETPLIGAKNIAEKLRKAIEEYNFQGVGHKTASFGVAELRQGDNADDFVARADAALYRAKANGRNRVEAIE